MPIFVFIAAMFFAALADIISIVVFIGNMTSFLFINFARLSFWIAGYHGKGTAALTAGTALIELTPGFSIVPGCMFFVWRFYRNNHKNTKHTAVLVA